MHSQGDDYHAVIMHAFYAVESTILDKIVGTLYIYLAKYDHHFQQGLTAPPFPPFNVALSVIESQVVTQHCMGGGRGALDNKILFLEINLS